MLGYERNVIVQCCKCGSRSRVMVFVCALGMYVGGCDGGESCCGEFMRPIRQHKYKKEVTKT